MIEYFILELGCSNSEKTLKWEVNSRLILTQWRVRETRHFPVVERKATAGVMNVRLVFSFKYKL